MPPFVRCVGGLSACKNRGADFFGHYLESFFMQIAVMGAGCTGAGSGAGATAGLASDSMATGAGPPESSRMAAATRVSPGCTWSVCVTGSAGASHWATVDSASSAELNVWPRASGAAELNVSPDAMASMYDWTLERLPTGVSGTKILIAAWVPTGACALVGMGCCTGLESSGTVGADMGLGLTGGGGAVTGAAGAGWVAGG